ncbi:hypothetical protein DWW59_15845, partial [Firmicutes bacterium AF16-15]
LILEIIFNVQFSRYKHNLLCKLLREIAARFSVFPPEHFAFLCRLMIYQSFKIRSFLSLDHW